MLSFAKRCSKLAVVLLTLVLSVSAFAADTVRQYDIPQQPLGQALREFALLTGMDLLFSPELVAGRESSSVKGSYNTDEALAALLKGTGLHYSVSGSRVILRRADVGSVDPQPSESMALARVDPAASESSSAAPSQSAGEGIEEIIVTAQKREEKLRDVPISISAVTGAQLERRGASRISDYAGYIPALNFSVGDRPGQGEIILRGVTTATSPAAATAVYVDEVPTTTHGTWGANGYKPLDLFPYDLERVEVLRGPQGTLYGDSTIGGLIKYVTRQANADGFSAAVGVEGMSISGGESVGGSVRGMVNIPVSPGLLGVRLSAFAQQTPGYITNIANGDKGINEMRQRGGRLAARLTPNDALSVEAQWLHTELETDGLAETLLASGTKRPLYGDYKGSSPIREPSDQGFDLVAATVRYDFGPVNLTSVSSYSKATNDPINDLTTFFGSLIPMLTGGAINDGLVAAHLPVTNEKYTQELRLASALDQRITWLIGGYYSREDTDSRARYVPLFADGTPITDLLEFYDEHVKNRYTDFSFFGNATFNVTDRWEVSAGVRHSRITEDFHDRLVGLLLSGSPTVPYFDDIETNDRATTWSLGARYVASDDLMVFARAASGFRAGGINYTWPGAQKRFDPDSMVSYEVGIRADFLDDRVTTDLTVYYLDWTDLFILAYTQDEFQFGYQTNGGKAAGLGMEFTATVRPMRGLTLTATAACSGLKARESLPTLGAEDGDRTPNSPAWSGSLAADYVLPLTDRWNVSLGGGVRIASHTYSLFIHDPQTMRISSYEAIDLNAGVSNDRWTFRGYVKNLTNEDTLLSLGTRSQARGVQMQPRTVGVAVDLRF